MIYPINNKNTYYLNIYSDISINVLTLYNYIDKNYICLLIYIDVYLFATAMILCWNKEDKNNMDKINLHNGRYIYKIKLSIMYYTTKQ